MVEYVDLLNRDRGGQRCRAQTADLVTRLASLCLPSSRTLWSEEVDGQCVWDALRPRPRNEVSDALMNHLPRDYARRQYSIRLCFDLSRKPSG